MKILTKLEALSALARQPRAAPVEGDWLVAITPADPTDYPLTTQRDGLVTYVEPGTAARLYYWAESAEAIPELVASLKEIALNAQVARIAHEQRRLVDQLVGLAAF
jgi:hypothetical protein